MPSMPPAPGTTGRRDWRTARAAVRQLMADPTDTVQVFRIMRALNVGNGPRNYARLIASAEGGRVAFRQPELAPLLADPAYVARFAPGTVGAAYRDFLARTGYSADGLAGVSSAAYDPNGEHPYFWLGRRIRDVHDLWHVLTGYDADEVLGEACLVAFSHAQLGGLGWAFIAATASVKHLVQNRSPAFAAAVWEAWLRGRRAAWLLVEDHEKLLNEPLEAARARLNLPPTPRYAQARAPGYAVPVGAHATA